MVFSLLEDVSLYLVGMMGSGKSTVGQVLAQRLDYQFFDTDTLIEQVTGQSIPAIFATHGERAFRQLESQVLAELSPYKRLAIATGGGIVLRPENWGYLHHGVVVWLDAPVTLLHTRLQENAAHNPGSRPLLNTDDLRQRLGDLLDQRQAHYTEADIRVTVQPSATPEEVAQRVLEKVAQRVLADDINQMLRHRLIETLTPAPEQQVLADSNPIVGPEVHLVGQP